MHNYYLAAVGGAVNGQNAPTPKASPEEDPADSFSTYLEYNKVLRTWFVAFGVGGPALFLVNEKIAQHLAKAGLLREVAALFLIGAAAQVLGAFLNKVSNWYVYMGGYQARVRATWQYRLSAWFTEALWFDIAVDVITIACFGAAAWKMLTIFSTNS
ncbi:MAG: hypothetical protein AB1452_03115 [Pseudomonadota bacterium]